LLFAKTAANNLNYILFPQYLQYNVRRVKRALGRREEKRREEKRRGKERKGKERNTV